MICHLFHSLLSFLLFFFLPRLDDYETFRRFPSFIASKLYHLMKSEKKRLSNRKKGGHNSKSYTSENDSGKTLCKIMSWFVMPCLLFNGKLEKMWLLFPILTDWVKFVWNQTLHFNNKNVVLPDVSRWSALNGTNPNYLFESAFDIWHF